LFGVVQDLYCGLRRIAARRLTRAALLHAAAVQLRDRTLLFLGNKASGKSFASYACMLSGADHVASDKTCVWSWQIPKECRRSSAWSRSSTAWPRRHPEFFHMVERCRSLGMAVSVITGEVSGCQPREPRGRAGQRRAHSARP
jgi:hypothetical protein